jgi:hypothetical protein
VVGIGSQSPRFAQVALGADEARYVVRVRVRILLDRVPIIPDPAAIAGDTDVGPAEAFPEVFGLQAEIVYGKARAG